MLLALPKEVCQTVLLFKGIQEDAPGRWSYRDLGSKPCTQLLSGFALDCPQFKSLTALYIDPVSLPAFN